MEKGPTADESPHEGDDVMLTPPRQAYLNFMIIVGTRSYPAALSVGGKGPISESGP